MEYQAGVSSDAVDMWNDWAGVIGDGVGVNWHDPENYNMNIDAGGGLGAFIYPDTAPEQGDYSEGLQSVSYTHLRAHETKANLVCRLMR